jgi:hypothetical protein
MPWWRREALHEKLAREGDLILERDGRERERPPWDKVGIHGLAMPRQWDAVVTVQAPDLEGGEAAFVTLPDGTVLPEDETPQDGLGALARAVEETLAPPYRAEAVRRTEEVWAVAARSIDVAALPVGTPGNAVTISAQHGDRTTLVDGEEWFASLPALEALARERNLTDFVLEANRLHGELWEVRISPL